MDFSIRIDPKSSIPIFVQIMSQIKHLIASGALQPGQQLPTIRELAVSLTVNLHTVAHAYAELEKEGLLTIQRGRGTFVSEQSGSAQLEDVRALKLQSLVEGLFVEALNLGYDAEEVRRAVEQHMERWRTTVQQSATDGREE
ncbi:MAG: GntR family transcriptional regulator [Anaerolineae bacterium]|nr:GntR family transcriptional regulator [Anaerolineae bacterium]